MIHLYRLKRYSDNGDSSQGLFQRLKRKDNYPHIVNWEFVSYALEDEKREEKVMRETRIDPGFYELKQRKVLTPLTRRYRQLYDWFKWHIEIIGLPRHNNIYIHIGNDEGDTDGCPMLQDMANNNTVKRAFNQRSTQAFKRWYLEATQLLEQGDQCFILIEDED